MAKSVGENFVCENVIDAHTTKQKKRKKGGVETKLSPTYLPSFRLYTANKQSFFCFVVVVLIWPDH